jgi:hypothetical protein
MEIGPIDGNRPLPREERARPKERPEEKPEEAIEADRSEISDTARRLAEEATQDRNRVARAEYLQREKMRLIRKRVEDGYYSRQDIIEKMADRILEEEELSAEMETDSIAENPEKAVDENTADGWENIADDTDTTSNSANGLFGV